VNEILQHLSLVLTQRKTADPKQSYVASLYAKGVDAIAKKIGEEATEVVIAAKNGDTSQLIYEVADLWFHTLVLLSHQGLTAEAILNELARREGIGGLEEKAQRNKK